MKKPISYKPKYSLSIRYLKMIMSSADFKTLMKKYVEKKKQLWGKYNK